MRIHSIYPEEFPEPWASDWGEDEYGLWMGFTYKGVRQLFRWIEPGTFLMGSPEDEPEREENEMQHQVIISQGYWLAESTVTQALWEAVMGENPSKSKGLERPVETVSWDDAQYFIAKMNGMKPAIKLCLPTEAQWEYACRAGTVTPFCFGEQITSNIVNFNGSMPYNRGEPSQYRGDIIDVKALPPNAWGLYEMHGNVREWCQDGYDSYPATNVIDPLGADTGQGRVLRGGSCFISGSECRSAARSNGMAYFGYYTIGFRLARSH
jgi:formylglycine-generating enzyme